MRLIDWLSQNNITPTEMADRIGGVTVEAVKLWAAGNRMPETRNVLRIEAVTDGQVTVRDLHEARAEKLKETRP
jgi:DNA-binding transcriptional regulator YdaS (Cro superfamily)